MKLVGGTFEECWNEMKKRKPFEHALVDLIWRAVSLLVRYDFMDISNRIARLFRCLLKKVISCIRKYISSTTVTHSTVE